MREQDKTEQAKTEQHKGPSHPPAPRRPADTSPNEQLKQKAEENEVAGRHKNDGQKDHKGAR